MQTRASITGPATHRVSPAFHLAAALGVAAMLAIALRNEPLYELLVQEDRFIEWLTVAFFVAAAMLGGIRALRRRSILDGLVAAFCVAAAGEEVSWGQRLLRFTPPEVFLANNAQQEANLHNLFEAFGQPKWTLIGLLVAYGLALPLAWQLRPLRVVVARLRMTPPPLALAPWYAVAVALLIAYPVRFTGEWVEALAGALFLFSLRPSGVTAAWVTTLCAAAAFAADRSVGALVPTAARSPELLACARAEATGFLGVLTARVPDLADDRLHRRVWSAWQATASTGFVPHPGSGVPSRCGAESATEALMRRRYAIDPWGNAYWLRVTREAVVVYSFGPDRRRTVGSRSAGDDIVAGSPPR